MRSHDGASHGDAAVLPLQHHPWMDRVPPALVGSVVPHWTRHLGGRPLDGRFRRELGHGTHPRVRADCLGRGVRPRVALRHRQARMAEEQMNVDFSRTGLNRPGSECVPEAMRVDAIDIGLVPEVGENLV